MKFTVVTILVLTLEVVYPVCDIAGLLYLRHKASLSYSMYASSRDEKHITLLHVILRKSINNGVILHHCLILVGSNLLLESIVQFSVCIRIKSVPHLCLASCLSLAHCRLIIGMYLYGQILARINELYQQRELVTILLIDSFSYKLVLLLSHEAIESHTLELSFGNDRLITLYSRYLPTLTDIFQIVAKMFKRYYPVTAPQSLLEQWLEFQ